MTCIIGYIDKKNNLWMGADSCGSDSSSKVIRKDTKLFNKGDFLIGYTSSFRIGQLLRFKWVQPEQSKSKGEYEFMCSDVIDSIRKCLKDNGYITVKNNVEEIGEFLVGYKNRLYKISTDLQVGESINNFGSCGYEDALALDAIEKLDRIIYGNKNLNFNVDIGGFLVTTKDNHDIIGSISFEMIKELKPLYNSDDICKLVLKIASKFAIGVEGPFIIKKYLGDKK